MAQVEEVKILQVDTSKSVNAVRELRKSMKDLDSAFISGKISEEEYVAETKKLESEMFKVTDAHKDAKLSINDFGVQMKNVATVGKAVTSALTGIQAGMNALGLESSGVAEKISKLQNLQAMTVAFGALKDDGVKAFNGLKDALGSANKGLSGFKKALIGTGIGAIVVAIGLLIANFDELNNWIKNVTGGALDLTKVFDGLKGIFENIGPTLKSFGNLVLQYLLAPFRTVIDTAKGLGNIFQNLFKGDFDGVKKAAEDMSSNIKSNFIAIGDAAKDFGSTVAEGYTNGVKKAEEKVAQKAKEEAAKKAEEYKKQQNEILNQRKATLDAELAYQKATHDKEWSSSQEYKNKLESYYNELLGLYSKTYGEESLEYKKILTEKLTSLRDFITNEEQAIIDANNKKLEEERKRAEEELKIAEQREKDKQKLIESLDGYGLTGVEKYQKELDDLRLKYEEEYNLLAGNLEAQALLQQKYADDVAAVHQKVAEDSNAALEEQYAKVQDRIGKANQLASFATSMLDSFADAQDKTTKEGFEKSKKMQVASATIQMLQGIATAISGAFTTKSGPWDIILAAAQAASIAVAGGIQINKIKQQKFDGGSTSISAPTVSMPTAADIANSSLNTREIISDSEAQSNLEATKVYVTESDIASTTKKVQTVESENTL